MPRRSDSACCNPIEARATCRRRYQTTAATPATAAATTRTSDSGSISTPLMSQRKDRSTRLNSLPLPTVSSLMTSGWPSGLDALHAAVRLGPPQQAQEGLGLRPVQRDHVPATVRGPGLPVFDHSQDAVSRPLLHRHELRHLRRGPRVLEGPLEHRQAMVRDDRDLVRDLIQEAAVVAHDEQHSRIGLQGRGHDLLALDVEVVRRLVEDEEVVVLAPFGPTRPTLSPFASSRSTSAKRRRPPWDFATPSRRTTPGPEAPVRKERRKARGAVGGGSGVSRRICSTRSLRESTCSYTLRDLNSSMIASWRLSSA